MTSRRVDVRQEIESILQMYHDFWHREIYSWTVNYLEDSAGFELFCGNQAIQIDTMAPDKALTLYICWLVPSIFSFILSVYLAYHILSKPSLRGTKRGRYQTLVLTLCFVDIIKSGCWFLGEKYTNPYGLCYTQEIMMQGGTLYQNYICLLMCILAYATVNSVDSEFYKDMVKSKVKFQRLAVIVLIIPTVCVITSAVLQSPKLWCAIDMPVYHTAPRDVQIAIIAYNVCFSGPHFLALIVQIGFCIVIQRK